MSEATRPLSVIAREITADWKSISPHAAPYLAAMRCLDKPDEQYGSDSARSVVNYFLSNAGGWRGDTARRVKKELKDLTKDAPW